MPQWKSAACAALKFVSFVAKNMFCGNLGAMTTQGNELIIVGGGAAGLMAAITAGELGLKALVLERRHRPGLKLLITGNNRCNLSHLSPPEELLRAYGEPCAGFLRPAVEALPPQKLCNYLKINGLQTTTMRDGRVYPLSERADDVLHFFLDRLRELAVPLTLNCPVRDITALPSGGFRVTTESGFSLEANNILLATGGVSYPKTGSVGDGQRLAAQLGHTVTPLRAGLAGVDIDDNIYNWLANGREDDIPDVALRVLSHGETVATLRGNILCCGGILRGAAIFDATRLIARRNLRDFELRADFAPNTPPQRLNAAVMARLLPPALSEGLRRAMRTPNDWARLKDYPLSVQGIRPLKEAIVTVGGVSLEEIDPRTMQSKIRPGLYFAGELMDVDGPTGGYNLHAAFATARLAVQAIAGRATRPQGDRDRRETHERREPPKEPFWRSRRR